MTDDAAPGEGGAPSGPDDPLNAPGLLQNFGSGLLQQFTTPGAAMQPNPYPQGSEEATWYDQNRQDTMNQWAPGMALNMVGTGAQFAEPGALGIAGGRPPRKPAPSAEAQARETYGVAPLDMSTEARMQRAADQGYTIDAYKGGQFHDWNTIPEYNRKGEVIKGTENRVPQELTEMRSTFGPDKLPTAGFYSSNPEVSNRFAAPFEYGSVMPAKIKMENPLVIDAKGQHAAAFQFPSIARERGTIPEMGDFHYALSPDSPHDGVILKNTKDEGDVYVPKNPSQVRSRFAKFDPANISSGNLLGSVAAAGAAGAAVSKDDDLAAQFGVGR